MIEGMRSDGADNANAAHLNGSKRCQLSVTKG